jgi:hypothetical protein
MPHRGPAGLSTLLGAERLMRLGLIVANVGIWLQAIALPAGLAG